MARIALKDQRDLVSMWSLQRCQRKVFIEKTKILEDVEMWLICTFMDLKNTESSVRESVWCQKFTYTSSSFCMFLQER